MSLIWILKILEYVCMKFKRSKNIKTLILLNMVFSKINGLNFNTNRMFSISQLSFQNLAFLFLYLHPTVYKYELNFISNFISSPKSNLNSSAKFLGSNSFWDAENKLKKNAILCSNHRAWKTNCQIFYRNFIIEYQHFISLTTRRVINFP